MHNLYTRGCFRPYPTHRSAALLGQPGERASLPAHSLTAAPHAQTQVISSCGPRGLYNPPSVTTKDETFWPLPPLHWLLHISNPERMPRCTTSSGSSLIFIQRHEGY